MIPKLMIATVGKCTRVFLGGKDVSKGVTDIVYSARNKEGELRPTLRLLEVDVNNFSIGGEKDFDEWYEFVKGLSVGEPKTEKVDSPTESTNVKA